MFRTTAHSVTVCLSLAATPALACLPPLTECSLGDGRYATLQGYNASGVLFSEYSPDGTASNRTVLVECQSRRAVAIIDPEELEERDYDAYDLMADVLFSEAAVTLRQVARDIRALGVDAQIFTLPAGHCGCDLPAMEPEYFACPEF